MADVFISYAHEDAAAAERLAGVLEGLGLSVWWDRTMVSGEPIHEVVTREIDAAKAVVVLWSPNSVASRWVAAEASAAEEQGKLASVMIEPARLPVYFRALRFEDLSGWSGDTSDKTFQRLWLQVAALARGQAAADLAPFDGRTAPTAAPARAVMDEAALASMPVRAAALLGIVAALFGMIAYFAELDVLKLIGPYAEALAVVIAGVFALFYYADWLMPEGPKALVRRWLAARPDERPIGSAEAFQAMFVAVYGERHWSWRCFSRSALTTITVFLGLVALFVDWTALFEGAGKIQQSDFQAFDNEFYSLQRLLAENALILLFVLPLTNILVDYVSLWQTRTVLGWTTRWLPLPLGVLLDFALTAAVFLAVLPLGPMLVIWGAEGFSPAAVEKAWNFAPNIWRGFWAIFRDHPWAELDALLRREASVPTTTMIIAFATTFITSIWLVLALFFAPLVRLVAAVPLLGAMIGARLRPIAALGVVVTTLLGASGAAAFGVARFAERAPDGAVRDCDDCPWMRRIEAGPFPPGSDFAKAGVEIAKPFAIGVYEVTFREWDACAATGEYCRSNPRPSDYGFGRGRRPVVDVSYDDITGERGFLAWLNSKVEGAPYRLPSEAEWAFAARGGVPSERNYYDRDVISYRDANFIDGDPDFAGSARRQTLPVGAFDPNPWGLHDMLGNVWEWVQDCHDDLDETPKDGSAKVMSGCSRAVLRGGSWSLNSRALRSDYRGRSGLDLRNDHIGFRVSRTLVE